MKKSKLILGTSLLSILLITGCSSAETPRLEGQAPSTSASASASEEGTQTSDSHSPSESNGGESTSPNDATSSPEASEEETPADENSNPFESSKPDEEKLITSGNELPKDTFGEENNESIVIPHPEYEVENESDPELTTTVDGAIESELNTVFTTYMTAIKNSEWEKACSVIDFDPGKGLQFCIDTMASGKWNPSDDFTLENSVGYQNSVSGVVMYVKKSESTTDRETVRFIKNSEGQWKVMIPSLAE